MYYPPHQKGKIILKIILIVCAIGLFVYLYSLIRRYPYHTNHLDIYSTEPVDMLRVYTAFSSFVLLMIGMPLIR